MLPLGSSCSSVATTDEIQAIAAVRAADRDRYLSVLYAPEEKRPALYALYAFNAEIASIRDRVRQALPGEIRLQWWRDAILNDQPQGHPLAEQLLAAIRTYELPRKAFDDCLEARIFDLYDDPMPSRADLEGYCGETASALIQLACLILDRDAAPAVSDGAGHAGCAQAITGLIRLLPLHRARGQCYVPKDVLSAAGTTSEDFIAGRDLPAAQRAVAAMAALAAEHLAKFEVQAAGIAPSLRPAFLPLALTGAYLARIARPRFDALTESADISVFTQHWLMFRRASRGWG
jgi:15-cis-phytoene synthase